MVLGLTPPPESVLVTLRLRLLTGLVSYNASFLGWPKLYCIFLSYKCILSIIMALDLDWWRNTYIPLDSLFFFFFFFFFGRWQSSSAGFSFFFFSPDSILIGRPRQSVINEITSRESNMNLIWYRQLWRAHGQPQLQPCCHRNITAQRRSIVRNAASGSDGFLAANFWKHKLPDRPNRSPDMRL